MINLNIENNSIELNTHSVEGVELYKAQDLLIGYGMDSKEASVKLDNWVRSMKSKLREFHVVSKQGKNGGTYLTKRQILKLAGYVSYEFEDAVYEAFELLAEGKVHEAEKIAKTALEIAIDKAVQNNREGKLVGKQVSKALQECTETPIQMIDVLANISKRMSNVSTGNGREGYWQQARVMVEKLSKDYRMTSKTFDLGIHCQYEKVMHYCTKRIAQLRA